MGNLQLEEVIRRDLRISIEIFLELWHQAAN